MLAQPVGVVPSGPAAAADPVPCGLSLMLVVALASSRQGCAWPGGDISKEKLTQLEADALRWQEACERTNAQVRHGKDCRSPKLF